MTRSCGECTKCCRTMAIVELDKPPNVWCPHCTIGVGCKIYKDRPSSCQEFECIWLQDPGMPDELRPDRSKVVLSVNADSTAIVAYVDPKQAYAWKQGAMGRMLQGISQEMPVIVVCGSKRTVMTVEKQPVEFDEQQPDGSVVRYSRSENSPFAIIQKGEIK